ncbi:MAG: hypothetical protein J7L96_06055, partial [Bacteroidales bacterium]|nr:hypothetical protein [Bacteroidales bacterium]
VEKDEIPFEISGHDEIKLNEDLPDKSQKSVILDQPEPVQEKEKVKRTGRKRKKSNWITGMGSLFDEPE